jgi:hypothetical protein
MMISFDVAGVPARFRRNAWTGSAELRVADDVVVLQSPLRLSTQFNVHTSVVWRHRAGEHDIVIEKVRPRLFGGFRPNVFTIAVDGKTVAEATGM